MENQNSSHMPKKPKTTKKKESTDPCPICNKELYLDKEYTQRVGLLDDFDEIIGWMCPHCRSEFDKDGKINNLGGTSNITGEA